MITTETSESNRAENLETFWSLGEVEAASELLGDSFSKRLSGWQKLPRLVGH